MPNTVPHTIPPAAPEPALSVAEARRVIFEAIAPIAGWEVVPVRDALGRVLARDIIAPFDVPAHDNSAMDGYAVRAGDLAATGDTALDIVGTALAGNAFSGIVGAGKAVRVMTGAVLPRGADTVVEQEVVRLDGDRVHIPSGQKAGKHVRRAGEDLAKGRPALAAGKRIGPAELGLIASLGYAEATVRRRLRVAYFSTGDELASIGKLLAPGEIYDSNRYTLYGALAQLGVDIIDMGVVRDDPVVMEEAFRQAAQVADVVLTSGGVSVGDADYVKDMVKRLGAVTFWKMKIKPGRPMAFGRVGDAWLFGMPGNPVAVMVTFYAIVQDALLKLMGAEALPRPTFSVPLVEDFRKRPGRLEFLRGRLFEEGGAWKVRMAGSQGSGVLSSMSQANCFIVLPEAQGDVAAGDPVQVQPFAGLMG